MDLYTRLRRHILSWTHETPLPTVNSESWPTFQYWYHFHHASQQWIPVTRDKETPLNDVGPSNLTLVTWNIDATSARAEDRVTDIITFITESHPEVHIIFLQEVSRPALQQILKDKRIRDHWVSSERDDALWGKQSSATMSLLSKARFPCATLGPIWRVSYPSHFNRDALCCDVFVPSRRNPQSPMRVRLANVHLDSLPIKPSHRPRQISIVSSYLRSAGCGVVAGNFNPVLDEDATLLERNGLADIWTTLRPEDPGYTWGVDGEQPFPPNRMDKVAVIGLESHYIEALAPGRLGVLERESSAPTITDYDESRALLKENLAWSDHHALVCSFGPDGQ